MGRYAPVAGVRNLAQRPGFPAGNAEGPDVRLGGELVAVDDLGCRPLDGKLCALGGDVFIVRYEAAGQCRQSSHWHQTETPTGNRCTGLNRACVPGQAEVGHLDEIIVADQTVAGSL